MAFIAIPVKKTYAVDLAKPLKNWYHANYTQQQQSDGVNYDEVFEQLDQFRNQVTSKNVDIKHETTLDQLQTYYDQLCSLMTCAPQAELQISFKWRDVFDKGGTFLMSSNSLSITSMEYEKCCILFNIAAVMSQIAASMANESNNDVSMKTASKYFQAASGIFSAIKHLTPLINQQLTSDLNSDMLSFFGDLMLAQAQELFFHKASADKMKEMIIARIANQAEDYYQEALKQIPLSKLSSIDKDWAAIVTMKQLALAGIVQYYEAEVCNQGKDFGKTIARSAKAIDLLKSAESKGGSHFNASFKSILSKANRLHEESKKDNDFIYHAKIPDVSTLKQTDKASLVKATPLPDRFKPEVKNAFDKLLPVAVQMAGVMLDLKRRETVDREIAALRELTSTLNNILSTYNLPAALEDKVDLHEMDDSLSATTDNEQSDSGTSNCLLLEQDRFLPIANISRIMKRSIPASGKIAKEAKECVQECISEFICFITSEASERCVNEKRKTINGEDILFAMSSLGFDNYVGPLKLYLQKYRELHPKTKNENESDTSFQMSSSANYDSPFPIK